MRNFPKTTPILPNKTPMTPDNRVRAGRIIDMGFSQEMAEKLIYFVPKGQTGVLVKEGFDPLFPNDHAFLLFLQYMGFTDIGTAYHIYHHDTKNFSPSVYHKDKEKMKIQCMYDLYGAENIQKMVDILKKSGLRMIKSGSNIFLIDDIIKKLNHYLVVYGSLEHLDKEIGEGGNIISRSQESVEKIIRDGEGGYSESIQNRIQRKQQLLHTHVFKGGKIFTRALGIRWHVQRIFAKFDQNGHEEWHNEWKKELGL